ncbi:bifunctional oligoribonuclease/PAP phosphatase NrnA [Candidatus Omnitrophota bacterium]
MSVGSVKTIINKFDKFVVSAHINPEGDSIGSQIAIASLLTRLGKEVLILNESPVPHFLQFMGGADKILNKIPPDLHFQAVIILDCPVLARVGNISEAITKDKVVINIDHHVSNENFGRYNWVDPMISSTGEMIFELFKAFKLKIEYSEAVALYVAIMTDTGSFRYTNTSAETHKRIAELVDIGVKPYDIFKSIYEVNSLQAINLLSEALKTLKLTDDGYIAWLWVTKEMLKKTKASLDGIEGMINFARSIEGVQIAILFRETGTENRCKVSFRSKDKADVNKLASFFGGGGHATASGCIVSGKTEEVEKAVLKKAQEMLD